MDIPIVYEDADILLINKPAGITVNKADTTRNEMTVQEWAEDYVGITKVAHDTNNVRDTFDNFNAFYERGGVVHRLDKETSGILILAKNPEAFINLQNQFKERVVEKTYVALTHGKIIPPQGEINVPVGRLPWNRMHFGVVPGGRESVTFYKTTSYYRNKKGDLFTYLDLHPKTGRTHQIRVHLKYIGHPIFSDFLYAGRKTARIDRKILGRVFLHAAKISFNHPKTGGSVSFESSLPKELSDVLEQMDSGL